MKIEILDNTTGLVFAIAEQYVAGKVASVTLTQDDASTQFIHECELLFNPPMTAKKTKEAAKLVAVAEPVMPKPVTVTFSGPVTSDDVQSKLDDVRDALTQGAQPPITDIKIEGSFVTPEEQPKPKKKSGGRGKKKEIVEPDPPEPSPPPEPEVLETPPVAEDMAQLKKELTKVFFQLLRSPNGKRAALEIGKKYNMGSNTNNVADDQVLDAIREVNERLNGHA